MNPNTKRLIRKRKEWRSRAVSAACALATWPAGKPGRDEIEAETIKCFDKLRQWFRAPRVGLVTLAIQRRAVRAYRESFTQTQTHV